METIFWVFAIFVLIVVVVILIPGILYSRNPWQKRFELTAVEQDKKIGFYKNLTPLNSSGSQSKKEFWEATDMFKRVKKEFDSFPFHKITGMELINVEKGFSHIGLSYKKELTNHYGFLHGGVIYSLIDSAMWSALVTLCDTEQFAIVTETLSVNNVFSVGKGESIEIAAQLVSRKFGIFPDLAEGKTLFCDAIVENRNTGTVIAFGLGVYKIVKRK